MTTANYFANQVHAALDCEEHLAAAVDAAAEVAVADLRAKYFQYVEELNDAIVDALDEADFDDPGRDMLNDAIREELLDIHASLSV